MELSFWFVRVGSKAGRVCVCVGGGKHALVLFALNGLHSRLKGLSHPL